MTDDERQQVAAIRERLGHMRDLVPVGRGNNDATVRDQLGRIAIQCFGHEGRTEVVGNIVEDTDALLAIIDRQQAELAALQEDRDALLALVRRLAAVESTAIREGRVWCDSCGAYSAYHERSFDHDKHCLWVDAHALLAERKGIDSERSQP